MTSAQEVERQFRAALKALACLRCGEPISDPAIDWGFAQPMRAEKDGPFPLKCDRCGAIQHYDYLNRLLSLG